MCVIRVCVSKAETYRDAPFFPLDSMHSLSRSRCVGVYVQEQRRRRDEQEDVVDIYTLARENSKLIFSKDVR